jgi:hypothetical protein
MGKRTIVSGTKSIDDLGLRGKIAIIGIAEETGRIILSEIPFLCT